MTIGLKVEGTRDPLIRRVLSLLVRSPNHLVLLALSTYLHPVYALTQSSVLVIKLTLPPAHLLSNMSECTEHSWFGPPKRKPPARAVFGEIKEEAFDALMNVDS